MDIATSYQYRNADGSRVTYRPDRTSGKVIRRDARALLVQWDHGLASWVPDGCVWPEEV
jgi:hypothetical protein